MREMKISEVSYVLSAWSSVVVLRSSKVALGFLNGLSGTGLSAMGSGLGTVVR